MYKVATYPLSLALRKTLGVFATKLLTISHLSRAVRIDFGVALPLIYLKKKSVLY